MYLLSLSLVILLEKLDWSESHMTETHWYDSEGHRHTKEDDHQLFLGDKLKNEFDSLTLEESKRRLR